MLAGEAVPFPGVGNVAAWPSRNMRWPAEWWALRTYKLNKQSFREETLTCRGFERRKKLHRFVGKQLAVHLAT